MNNTKADFLKRTIEIDKYFNFLTIIDTASCTIQYTESSGASIVQPIDSELLKVIKANGFLLLYNLIESTVIKSIEAIFNTITDGGLTFPQLSENLKKLWISHKGSSLKGVESININKIRDLMRNVAESIIANQIAQLETSCVSISGNIDAQEIRIIAKQFGFDPCSDGRHLVTIKTKRNHLAHGNFSFSEIGKDYSVQELIEFKNDAYNHLNMVMANIEKYINQKQFSNSPITIVA